MLRSLKAAEKKGGLLTLIKFFNLNLCIMGRGDKKTKRGKISKGSFGKSRPAKPGKNKKTKTEKPE